MFVKHRGDPVPDGKDFGRVLYVIVPPDGLFSEGLGRNV